MYKNSLQNRSIEQESKFGDSTGFISHVVNFKSLFVVIN